MAQRQTSDSLEKSPEAAIDNETTDNDQEVETADAFRKPAPKFKKRKLDEVDCRLLKALEDRNNENRHLCFFKGVLPSLENFSEEETLQFQMGVLQLITNIKSQRELNVNSEPMTPNSSETSSSEDCSFLLF